MFNVKIKKNIEAVFEEDLKYGYIDTFVENSKVYFVRFV